jgi:hypothetical protein
MIAGCLHKMGISMGSHFSQHPAGFSLYEDICLYGAFGLPQRKMRSRIIRYEAIHDSTGAWGFKNTLAWKSFSFLPELMRSLGHTLQIVVSHRTFMASVRARAAGRCPPGQVYSHDEATDWALRALNAMTMAVRLVDCPVLHVSYEDVIEDSHGQIQRLAHFVGVEATKEAIEYVDK